MAETNNIIGRADLTDAQVPDQVATDLIKEMTTESVMLSRARRVNMSAKKTKQPVLASLPDAYWVDGDTGLKQTTSTGFENLVMVAEELAAIVPIPDSLVADSNIPLWSEIQPLLVEAIGAKIDAATLFGVDKPESWPDAIVPATTKAKNVVAQGKNPDLAADVAELAGLVSKGGFAVNGFASEPGLNWELVGLRSGQGAPIYSPAIAAGQPSALYGYPLNEVRSGVWDASKAKLIAADWSKFVIGVRQDVTFDLFSEGVISDASGKVILNLMQQDTKALRVVMRVGWQVANPAVRLQGDKSKRYPAGVLTPGKPASAAA